MLFLLLIIPALLLVACGDFTATPVSKSTAQPVPTTSPPEIVPHLAASPKIAASPTVAPTGVVSPSKAPATPSPAATPARDENEAIGNLRQYYLALKNQDYATAYELVVRPNRGPSDRNDFILEHKAAPYLVTLTALQKQAAPPPGGSLVFQVTLNLNSSQPAGKYLPGDNTRFVEMVKDGGVWRVAGISNSPITPDSPAPTVTPVPKLPSPVPDTTLYVRVVDLSFINATRGWALLSSCKGPDCQANLRMTTDGGRSWHPEAAPAVKPGFIDNSGQHHDMVNGVHFANAQDGWLYGPGLYATHDGGTTWQAEKFSEDIVELTSVGNTVWATTRTCALANVCKFGLLLSTDNGHTWKNVAALPNLDGLTLRMAALTPQDVWLLSLSPDARPVEPGNPAITTFVVTHNGGQTWQKLTDPSYEKGCTNTGLAAANLKELWIACGGQPGAGQQFKYLYNSEDGGKSWTAVNPNPSISGGYFSSLAVTAPGKLWLVLARGTLITSNDGGQSWHPAIPYEQANPGDSGIGPVVFADAKHGWLAAQGRVFYTTDAGATWQPVALH